MAFVDNRRLYTFTGASNGTWFPAQNYEIAYTLHFVGSGAGDTCEVRVSNAVAQPADASHESLFGAAVATDQAMVSVDKPFQWMKVRKTAHTQTTTVDICAQIRR